MENIDFALKDDFGKSKVSSCVRRFGVAGLVAGLHGLVRALKSFELAHNLQLCVFKATERDF